MDAQDERQYQKTIVFNKHLPYADQLEEEAAGKLADIKRNLCAAVQNRDVTPGYIFWIGRLSSYIHVYGHQFSKQDHILFIKLAFELLTNCALETTHIHSLASLLCTLLKKRKLLTRDDLQLPWLPVYKLFKEVFYAKELKMGMKNYARAIEQQVVHFVSAARIYFPVESTQEMLDEFRPKLCVFDTSMSEGVEYLCRFLPVVMKPEEQARGFRVWFEELIHLWLDCHMDIRPESRWLDLFAHLAYHNVGQIDWDPYLPEVRATPCVVWAETELDLICHQMIFTRVLRSFQLPVGSSQVTAQGCLQQTGFYDNMNTLLVSLLGGDSKAQEHLTLLMVSIESFYHPSNAGLYSVKLQQFLSKLVDKFVARLHRERFAKPTWLPSTPESVKLTEEDIDAFVDCVLPAAWQCMFSRFGPMEAVNVFQQLAIVRPQKVLPGLLEKMYAAFETLTEPHQLFATLQCVAVVGRPLLGDVHGFPEGKSHLFPLLTLTLPGIDPNDYKKTLASAMLMSALLAMVPIVDSSKATEKHGLTESEMEVCSLTSQFEDFVLQLLDRCFSWIETSGLEQVALLDRQVDHVSPTSRKVINHESVMSQGIVGTVSTVLMQCSPDIGKVAVRKLFEFATTHLFESVVAGTAASDLCGAAAKYHPKETLSLFLPHCLREIDELLEDPEHLDSDLPDKTLVWKLQLLSKVLSSTGEYILPYADHLLVCLSKCVQLKAIPVYTNAALALQTMLRSLSYLYPTEGRTVNVDYSVPPEEHCYIRDWARPGDIHHMNIQWHTPSSAELDLVDKVLSTFLGAELDALDKFVKGEEMEREELNRRLAVVLSILKGCVAYLPMWEGDPAMEEGWPKSTVDITYTPFCCQAGAMVGRKPPESVSRQQLAVFFDHLTAHVTKTCEDDTKSLISLTKILKCLLINTGITRERLDKLMKSFAFTRRSLSDRLHRQKQHLRNVLVSRVYIQHEKRMVENSLSPMTALHRKLLHHLVSMSISTYPEVRQRAQEAVSQVVRGLPPFTNAIRSIVMELPKYLKEGTGVAHEQFKGALYTLKMPSLTSLYFHKLDLMATVLPALVGAGHSEKPSILGLVTSLVSAIIHQSISYQLEYRFSDAALAAAAALDRPLGAAQLEEGVAHLKRVNQERGAMLDGLIEKLVDLFEEGNLTWRFASFCVHLLGILMHWERPFSSRAVKVIVDGVVHENLAIRKVAIKALGNYLWLQKRAPTRIPVDFLRDGGVSPSSVTTAGEREDNEWLVYNPDRVPKTAEEWNNFPFVDKTHTGFYSWPKDFTRFAPLDQQPSLNRAREEMSEGECVVLDAFMSETYVAKLIGYLCLEEKKGSDHFSKSRMTVFVRLSKNYGDCFLPLMKAHLEELAVDSLESKQRCACEIISGIIRGSKHWTFDMVQKLCEFMVPLLRKVMSRLTQETLQDWAQLASEVSADRDPHRVHWLLELMAEEPLKGTDGSFQDASQLRLLHYALSQQEWRIGRFHRDLLQRLIPHLGYPYKTVRDALGKLLSCTTMTTSGCASLRHNLSVEEVVQAFLSALPIPPSATAEYDLTDEDSKQQIRVLKTAITWVIVDLPFGGVKPHFLPLLVSILPLFSVEGDDELTGLMKGLARSLSYSELPQNTVKAFMDFMHTAIHATTWKIRMPLMKVLQVMVFSNLFKFQPLAEELHDILTQLMEDDNVEVRERAAETMSGLIRCGLFSPSERTLAHFKKLSRSKVSRKRLNEESTDGPAPQEERRRLIRRHAGVLGLSALVGSCPYTVPEWLPHILEELAGHLHDPQPIPSTVKKAMSEFKRTHYDNWRDHKQKFTEDQLVVVNDLLVSPSYYA